MIPPSDGHRRELAIVCAITLLGAVVRCWDLGRLGLCHFDEGIYALSGLWAFSGRGPLDLDPMVIPYAPPGFPLLVGLSYWLTFPWPGASDLSAIAPSLVTGIATTPVVGWLGRRTFGPGAGAAAAAFAALSGPHVAFSRMALTDTTFLLTWLVALGLGMRFLERPGWGRAIAWGLAVGVAQNVKYNGWLVGLAIALAAAMRPGRREDAVRTFGLGIVAALVAALVYAPWLGFVERHGGYAGLLAHQRSYLGGIESWWPHWRSQLAQATALSGMLSGQLTWAAIASAAAGLGSALALREGNPDGPRRVGRLLIAFLIGVAAFGTMPNLPWWIGLVALPWLLRDRRPALRVVGTWWGMMSILTPLYHEYARLWLPLHAVGWLLGGAVVARLAPWLAKGLDVDRPARLRVIAATAACIALAAGHEFGWRPRARPLPALLRPTDSSRNFVAGLTPQFHGRETPSFRVLARPSLAYYFATSGRFHVRRAANLKDLLRRQQASEWIVLDEPLLRQEPNHPLSRWFLGEDSGHRDPLNGPTLLDVDPGAAFGRSTLGHTFGFDSVWDVGFNRRDVPKARIWLLKPGVLSRLPL